jgi:hypothetical protein
VLKVEQVKVDVPQECAVKVKEQVELDGGMVKEAKVAGKVEQWKQLGEPTVG